MSNRKTALVTGANRGMGIEIARQLGKLDHLVWLGCRDATKGQEAEARLRADGVDARFLQLDITDQASVRSATARLEAESASLDVLVNNVGIYGDHTSPASGQTVEDMHVVFDTNFYGTVRVTQALLPLLRKAASARIVMMSSGLGSVSLTGDMTFPTWNVAMTGYAASKAALNMFTVKLAKELLGTNIKVNAACPGAVATQAENQWAPRTAEEGALIAVRLATLDLMGPTGGFFHDGLSPGLAPYSW
jgi:NAD(P)-dependent dehydrogenase (short-subunit alcohol dehydrogenase family)